MLGRVTGDIGVGFSLATTLTAYIDSSSFIPVSPVGMRFGQVNASVLVSNGFLDGLCGRRCSVPAVVTGRERDSSDGQEHEGDENQSDGLLHCFFLLFIYFD